MFGSISVQRIVSKDDEDEQPLAREIAAICTEVLGKPIHEACSVQDDFFFGGGHSLVAAKAIQVIRKRLDVDVPFTAILAHPTPAGLAARLAEVEKAKHQANSLPPPMVLLQPSATDEPMRDIVVLPPIGGGLLPMAGVISAISARVQNARVLGIPWSDEHAGQSPQTIDHLVQYYARVLCDFCSRRTVSLKSKCNKLFVLGWSFGGTLVYEACKRLEQQLEEVQLLLLDAPTAEAAVCDVDTRTLAAENYAELLVEYVQGRSTNTREDHRKREECQQQNPVRSLTQALLDRHINEQTDLGSFPPIVRQVMRVSAWVTDTDIVEAVSGSQRSLQALYGTYRQEERENQSLLVPDGMRFSVLQVQVSRGLCTQLSTADLGWDRELAHQAGRVNWVRHIVKVI